MTVPKIDLSLLADEIRACVAEFNRLAELASDHGINVEATVLTAERLATPAFPLLSVDIRKAI